jgi:hypothetical protein
MVGLTAAMFTKTKHAAFVMSLRQIQDDWIETVLRSPIRIDEDSHDPELQHFLAPIADFDFRVLRVVTKRAIIPPLVITAFFDRTLKGKL